MAVVRGGTSEAITALLSKKLPTPELMKLWGEGVPFNPDFLRRTVSCLFSLASFPITIFYSRNLLKHICQSLSWTGKRRQSAAP